MVGRVVGSGGTDVAAVTVVGVVACAREETVVAGVAVAGALSADRVLAVAGTVGSSPDDAPLPVTSVWSAAVA